MGLFEKIFGRKPATASGADYFQLFTAGSPVWNNYGGRLYESELVRAAVDCIATHSSKLNVSFQGSAQPKLQTRMRKAPNSWQTWGQFLYRLRTILEIQGTAFIVPVTGIYGETTGIFPVLPSRCEILDVHGEAWIRYSFQNSAAHAALPLAETGILTKFQYMDDLLGTNNAALSGTMELIGMQQQGIHEGIKNGATFRFMAEMSNATSDKDIAKERMRFNELNLRGESGGILLFKNTMRNVKQLDQKPYVVDADQMKLIEENVFNYFGINHDVLQNKAFGDAWSAFYEGKIEPFAIQLSDVLTRMIFTEQEQGHGNAVFATSNRLQYMTNQDKLTVSAQLTDRGIMNRDEAREIWNLAPIPDGSGKNYVIRGEYKNAGDIQEGEGAE